MQAVLLAAGLGTRLRPITNWQPKCMVPINGRPLLDIWLSLLSSSALIKDVFVNTHYLAKMVEDFIAREWIGPFPSLQCWYEPTLLGTAGTLAAHAEELAGHDLLVIHADNLSVFKLDEFIYAHKQRPEHCKMTMMLFETDDPGSCGIVELDGQTVVAMHEKVANPPGNLANGAVYIMTPEVLKLILETEATDISTEVIPRLMGQIHSWVNTTYHRDIGTPDSLATANLDIKQFKLADKQV